MSAPSPKKKQEGWLGILLTALLCGGFLWWWFQPAPVTAETERNPLYWIGRARELVGPASPSLAQRLDILMIVEALRQHGESEAADRIEADWLPAAWRLGATSGPAAPADGLDEAAPSDALAPVRARLEEAAAAFDTLEIERAQAVLRDGAAVAATLAEPHRSQGLWLTVARQARNGLSADAVETRRQLGSAPAGDPPPRWLCRELIEGDVVAPVVAAHAARPADDPRVVALAADWRQLVRERLRLRDHPLFTRHGPATDASRPAEDAAAPSLWSAVEANHLGEAARLAGRDASHHLAIARLLAWLAAPPVAGAAGGDFPEAR